MTDDSVLIVGQGYVGLPLAMRAVEVGFDVTGLDLDAAKVKRLNAGESYIEDITDDRLRAALDSGRYRATADIDEVSRFDVAVISVPTPLKEGIPDLRFMEEAARALAPKVTTGATVVLESTTYPGTTDELVGPILEAGSSLTAGVDFHLGYSPERIDPGNATWTLENTPKVVSGTTPASLERVQSFFDHIVETTVPVSSTREAELTKLLENTFRHVNIALVNELAMFANDLGIDVWEAIDAAATKPFGFMKFTPGPGVGGHCLPVDPSYLSWQVRRSLGTSFRFVELANEVNDHMPDYVVRRITTALNREKKAVNGATVLLLGLAYKKNTGDARESPSRMISAQLAGLGADIWAVDPHVAERDLPPDVTVAELDSSTVTQADIVVLLVDHDAFDAQVITSNGTPVLDCRRVLVASDTVEHL
ncbi:MAG: nucleotide sugar dehydrogenase [Acidimicrobiales bacterium]|nr:nucleotide sugar dehydrogenase [Acidimicrobiales bacterium]